MVESRTYEFKVRARNKWGFGPFSPSVSITASGPPYKILNVTTDVSNTDGNVVILWSAPGTNGASITNYIVEFRDSSSLWKTLPLFCDGSSDSVVRTRSCQVSMLIFTSSDFLLAFDTLIQVRVTPVNAKGVGPTSDLLTKGARVRTVP